MRLSERSTSTHKLSWSQFLWFTIAGAQGTLAQYIVLIAGVQGLGARAELASSIGALTGAAINFWLNHYVTFRSRASIADTAPKFFAIAAVSMSLNWALMAGLVAGLGLHYLLSQ